MSDVFKKKRNNLELCKLILKKYPNLLLNENLKYSAEK